MSEGQAGVPPQLAVYRDTIDNLDAALVHLLAERFRCTQQVGLLKARLDLPPADPGREQQQVARLRSLAEESGLNRRRHPVRRASGDSLRYEPLRRVGARSRSSRRTEPSGLSQRLSVL